MSGKVGIGERVREKGGLCFGVGGGGSGGGGVWGRRQIFIDEPWLGSRECYLNQHVK